MSVSVRESTYAFSVATQSRKAIRNCLAAALRAYSRGKLAFAKDPLVPGQPIASRAAISRLGVIEMSLADVERV